MAVKALGALINPPTLNTDDTFTAFCNIAADGAVHYTIDCGTYPGGGVSATINVQIVAAIKAYAAASMGVDFGALDTARLLIGVDLL